MTSQPDEIRSMAEKIADSYSQTWRMFDGNTWLQIKIEEALRTVSEKAYREGQESMREGLRNVVEGFPDRTSMVNVPSWEVKKVVCEYLLKDIQSFKPPPRDA